MACVDRIKAHQKAGWFGVSLVTRTQIKNDRDQEKTNGLPCLKSNWEIKRQASRHWQVLQNL